MIFKTIIFYLFIHAVVLFAQETSDFIYPRDTTYTLKIAYQKYKKDYPFVKAVLYDTANGSMRYRNIPYNTPAGRPLMLDIFSTIRDSDSPRPVILLVHGGGWSSGDRSLMYPLADYLAKQGYISVAVEYRLSPEAKYPAAVNDIKNVLSWIIENGAEYKIDSKKIIILGCSAGAQLAGLVGLTFGKDDAIKAIINIDGVMDFTSAEARKHEDDPKRKTTAAGRWFGGRYSEKAELWKEASPLYYVKENAAPVLFINSSQPRFHVGRDQVIKKLDAFSIYSEIHTFDDAPHSFWLFDPWFERTALFIDRFLERVLNHKKE